MSFDKEMRDLYKDILGNYIQTQNEQILYQGQKLTNNPNP